MKLKIFLLQLAYFFFLLCILFIPARLHLFSFQETISDFLFRTSIEWITKHVFYQELKNPAISSDSLSLYVLLLLLFMLSLLLSCLLLFSKRRKEMGQQAVAILQRVFVYYLSLQLLLYGFDKAFKGQFYLPEPNTLYTPLGELSRDLLYWSTMGTSYSYNIFLGGIEVLAAIFLIFRRTKIAGLLLTVGIMFHVVAVNFSFNISVKLYSTFLLVLSLFMLSPQISRICQFLILQKSVQLKRQTQLPAMLQQTFLRSAVKTFVISVFFFEAFYPRIASGNFNDDRAARPFLHGAYEVQEVICAGNVLSIQSFPVKRIFIHRQGYIILQDQQNRMQDFKFIADSINHQFLFSNDQHNPAKLAYQYNEIEKILELHYPVMNQEYVLKARALDWKNLPALQKNFHFTVDEL